MHVGNLTCRQYKLDAGKSVTPSTGCWPVWFRKYSVIQKRGIGNCVGIYSSNTVEFLLFYCHGSG